MRKKGILLVLSFFLLSNVLLSTNPNCMELAKRIYDLQNRIVESSFIQLSPGAWATYSKNVKIVYLGEKISPKTGKKLRVLEFQSPFKGQLWFRISDKKFIYQGKKIRFRTLEPMEAYMETGSSVFYIPKELIEMFMSMRGGKEWSIILWEGKINVPPDCSKNKIKIYKRDYITNSEKVVNAVIIKSLENGGEVWASDKVPFGYVKTFSPKGKVSPLYLTDFGFSGGIQNISDNKIKNSKIMSFMGGFNK